MARLRKFARSALGYLRSVSSAKQVKARFGNAILFRSFAFVRRSQLLELYRRIGQLEELASHRGPLPKSSLGAKAKNPRSVAFLNNSYYNFYYLAGALRRRGWDAISVSLEDPAGPQSQFYHGNDLCLYDASESQMRHNLESFFAEAVDRFSMVHFYGRGSMSLFPSEYDSGERFARLPRDFIALRQNGIKIGYSVCGCLDGVAQSTFHRWSGGCCDRCVWQINPTVCNDRMNLAWGHKVEMFCDLIACEGFPALDYQSGPKAYREPLTTALDHEIWHPDLTIPEHLRLNRAEGELIVYHAVGNYDLRSSDERSVKGTGAVHRAVEQLRSDGMNVRLEFVTDVPSRDVRFIQVQADVVIDQLNHGRYGANAREAMMLGRPTICHINKSELPGENKLESIETCPLVSANESTLSEVLRDLLLDPDRRRKVGAESRKFAMKWHSADACAARFEEVFDRLMMNLSPAA